jgi:hypothetical protein
LWAFSVAVSTSAGSRTSPGEAHQGRQDAVALTHDRQTSLARMIEEQQAAEVGSVRSAFGICDGV